MAGYEYGNARLRAMRSRLLSKEAIREISEAGSLAELIGAIIHSPYRRSLELSLVQSSDLESIYQALRRDFVETVCKLRSFYEGSEGELVNLILREYDIANLKTIFRGLAHQAPRRDIESALLPVGELPEALFNELLLAANMRGAIDLLATIRHPFAQPLLILRAEHPGADVFSIELALDRWYFRDALRALKQPEEDRKKALAAVQREIDIRNILLVLRFVQAPGEKAALRGLQAGAGFESLLPAAGSLPAEKLAQIYELRSVKSALEALAATSYGPAARSGLLEFERTGRLSEIEKALRRDQLRWLAAQIANDPLGVGVVLGYLALKTNEINNLRRIARSIQLKFSAEALRAELEFVS